MGLAGGCGVWESQCHANPLLRYRRQFQKQLRTRRVLKMLAGCPLGLFTGAPKPAMAKNRVHCHVSLQTRSRAAQWRNEGPMKQVSSTAVHCYCCKLNPPEAVHRRAIARKPGAARLAGPWCSRPFLRAGGIGVNSRPLEKCEMPPIPRHFKLV